LSQSPDHTSIHASPYEWLRKMTVDCCFRPGEQLIIGQLAECLRVSPTPVREALIRLQAEALLDTMPRRGFFARTLRPKEMISVLQFKYAILKFSLEQAIHPLDRAATLICSPTSSIGNGIALRACAIEKESPDQPRECVRYVDQVWGCIAALSGNDVLKRAVSNANDRTHFVRMIDLEDAGRLVETRRMIEELSLALHRNEAAAAVAIMKTDLDGLIRRMPALVNEGISRAYAASSPVQANLRIYEWSSETT
jgi:DNA-binding GntR family transcriptional regulator